MLFIGFIIALILSVLSSWEAYHFLVLYFNTKKKGVKLKATVVELVPDTKTYGVIPIVELRIMHNILRIKVIASTFSLSYNRYVIGKDVVVYYAENTNECVLKDKWLPWIIFSSLFAVYCGLIYSVLLIF